MKRKIIWGASTDPFGRPLALVLTPHRWEYVPHDELV